MADQTDASAAYDFFDHTADIGIRARGASLTELCEQFARGLTALMAKDSIVRVVHNAGLARRVVRLRPLGVIKG